MRTLVLGGARSGKSAFAESLLAGAPAVDYVAASTLSADDPEWSARVAAHRLRRPTTWRTVETGDVAAELTSGETPALVDSITSWLTRAMDDSGAFIRGETADLDEVMERLVASWGSTPRRVVAVSDDVGGGIVPETAAGRLFRDTLGTLNQQLAAAADEVFYVVAGLPQKLK